MSSLHDRLRFLGRGVTNLASVAAIAPASASLVRGLVEAAGVGAARCVVELGPGVGPVTQGLLAAMPANAHLHAIELDGALVQALRRGHRDPRLQVVEGDATELRAHLDTAGCTGVCDAVVSSLGVSMMSDDLRARLLDAVASALSPSAPFVQYQHLTARLLTWQPDHGLTRFDACRWLQTRFRTITRRLVMSHVPPSVVLRCEELLAQPRTAMASIST